MGPRGRNGHKTSPKVIDAKIRAAKALELRKAGMQYAEIADKLGFASKAGAHDAVKRALDAIIREPAEALVTLELERMDTLWTKQFKLAQSGSVDALKACMKIMERRAKLLGLDAPAKQEIKNEVTTKSGVLMVPAAVDPQSWEAAAKAQQSAPAKDG